MATDCHCPNCGHYIGPEPKVDYFAKCSDCGHYFVNLNGDRTYTPKDTSKWKKAKGLLRRSSREVRGI